MPTKRDNKDYKEVRCGDKDLKRKGDRGEWIVERMRERATRREGEKAKERGSKTTRESEREMKWEKDGEREKGGREQDKEGSRYQER